MDSSVNYHSVNDGAHHRGKFVQRGLLALLVAGMLPCLSLALLWGQERATKHSETCDDWTPSMSHALDWMQGATFVAVALAVNLTWRVASNSKVSPWAWMTLIVSGIAVAVTTIYVDNAVVYAYMVCKGNGVDGFIPEQWYVYLLFCLSFFPLIIALFSVEGLALRMSLT